jgi:DNA-binding MarR family transcriptional regulator
MTSDTPNDSDLGGIMNLNRVVHEPARLLILGYLFVVESVDFLFLLNQTGLTKGNLASHLNTLENEGYIKVQKEFVGKIPRTMLSLTPEGRTAFKTYREQMKELLRRLPK